MQRDWKVVVSVRGESLASLSEVVAGLRSAGMTVNQVLDPIGAVTGTMGSSTLTSLRAVPGVADVELEALYQLPPEGEPQ
ncbi:hypothetical protein [Amycolatopsis minnesotensis]|uniref:Ketohydroxyglutarate aldolase n=1 Tax=Amycolatopsis minnesotensis TaxID=337894 RepID=A0ABP5DD34_9PSEU